jgi:hypothetical protein
MSNNPGTSGGGGGIIIGDKPLAYWLENFYMRLSPDKQLQCLGLVNLYNQGAYNLTPTQTQFLLGCAADIAASLDSSGSG